MSKKRSLRWGVLKIPLCCHHFNLIFICLLLTWHPISDGRWFDLLRLFYASTFVVVADKILHFDCTKKKTNKLGAYRVSTRRKPRKAHICTEIIKNIDGTCVCVCSLLPFNGGMPLYLPLFFFCSMFEYESRWFLYDGVRNFSQQYNVNTNKKSKSKQNICQLNGTFQWFQLKIHGIFSIFVHVEPSTVYAFGVIEKMHMCQLCPCARHVSILEFGMRVCVCVCAYTCEHIGVWTVSVYMCVCTCDRHAATVRIMNTIVCELNTRAVCFPHRSIHHITIELDTVCDLKTKKKAIPTLQHTCR